MLGKLLFSSDDEIRGSLSDAQRVEESIDWVLKVPWILHVFRRVLGLPFKKQAQQYLDSVWK